jgi:hypothetical protein
MEAAMVLMRSRNKPLTPGLRDRWEEHNAAVHATESEMSGRLLGGKPRSSSPRGDDGHH